MRKIYVSYVKQRTTAEQRLGARMLWHSTTRETHSVEFIAVIFDISRPTILELCADIPRVGGKFEFEILRPTWQEDRQRKALPVTDADWVLALIKASEHVERVLTKSSNTLQALLAQAQAQRIAA
jgi:hypothetical protein